MSDFTVKFKRILVTGCAGDIAIGICRILREQKIADEIWGCDIKPEGGCEYFFDKSIKICRAESGNWFPELLKIVSENNIELVIPTVENELSELVKVKSSFSNILMPNSHIIEICLDKYKTAEFLKCENIGVAKTDLLENSVFEDKALIVKPRSGRGSQGIYSVRTKEQFDHLKITLPKERWICQELLEPVNEEYTCGVFRSWHGDIRTLTFRRSLANGMTSSGCVEEIADISSMLTNVARKFGLVGAINVQCILTKDGPKIFEINPRFSSTVRFRHLLGFQDLIWSILDMYGKPLTPFTAPTAKTRFTRVYDEIIL